MPDRRPHANYDPSDKIAAQARFCKALAKEGNVSEACRLSKVKRATVYAWLKEDTGFKAEYDTAIDQSNDAIRHEIYRRGITGWVEVEETIEYGDIPGPDGKPLIVSRKTKAAHKYDSGLIKFLATSRMPEFRDRLDVTSDGKAVGNGWDNLATIISDPERANAASALIDALAGYSLDPGGPSVDSER